MIKIDCLWCIHTGGYGIWILVNLASLDVPLWVITCRFLLALLDVPWKPWQQHFAVHQIASVWNFTTDSRWQKLCGYQKSKKKKARVICSCDCQSHSLVLSCFPCFCLFCLFSFSYGQFWGRRTHPVSLSGRGCCDSSATHPQLPSATSHLVQRWAQDSTQQPHVSFLLLLFFFFLFVGPFVSYFAFLFDSRNTFWGFFCFPFFFPLSLKVFEGFSLRAAVPTCCLLFILLHFVLKDSLNFFYRTRAEDKTVSALCVQWNISSYT